KSGRALQIALAQAHLHHSEPSIRSLRIDLDARLILLRCSSQACGSILDGGAERNDLGLELLLARAKRMLPSSLRSGSRFSKPQRGCNPGDRKDGREQRDNHNASAVETDRTNQAARNDQRSATNGTTLEHSCQVVPHSLRIRVSPMRSFFQRPLTYRRQ